MKRKCIIVFSWLLVAALCVAIFHFSAQVADDSAEQSAFFRELFTKLFGVGFTEFFVRKMAHTLEYAALGFVSAFAFAYTLKKAKYFYFGIIFSFVYSITDEIHQLYVPGRSGQVRDVFVDLAGTLLGVLVLGCLYLIYRKVKGKKDVQGTQGN
ncbi:MAG: VanZ family protein [Clostridia bacterium]|nr:VanZ family protein [Clostridia bacterium]